MKERMVSTAPWFLLVVAGLVLLRAGPASPGSVSAQEKKESSPLLEKIPGSLEAMLEQALKTNPDILVAEAKIREAQAELNQIQLQVTEGIVSSYNLLLKQEQSVAAAARYVRDVEAQHRAGTISSDKLASALMARLDAETAMVQTEARLRYLLGTGGQMDSFPLRPEEAPAEPEPPRPTRPDIPEQFGEHLETVVNLSVEEKSLAEVLGLLATTTGCNIVLDQEVDFEELTVTLEVAELPLRSVLLLLHDTTGDGIVFVFREYGILATHQDKASTMKSAAIPGDAYLEEE